MEKNYYIGIDLGTSSIGWAATDEEYNFLRLNGKTAWGSRIFDEALDKKDRRSYRSNRRRMQRRKYRIQLLNKLFAEEISKVDSTFFIRLANSNLYLEDKDSLIQTNQLIFKTKQEEKDFYKQYPTIWHLRKAFIQNDPNAFKDIRYVYLALHHIIKYRGNFLFEGSLNYQKIDGDILDKLNFSLNGILENEDPIDYINKNQIEDLTKILENKNLRKKSKEKEIIKLFEKGDGQTEELDELIKMFATLVCGEKYTIKDYLNEEGKKENIDFNDSDFDNNIDKYMRILGAKFDVVRYAKNIYDYLQLKELLGNFDCLSEAMVHIYENHKADLKLLKTTIKDLDQKLNLKDHERIYEDVFKNPNNKKNYACLIHCNSKEKRATYPEFYSFILNTLKNHQDLINEDVYALIEQKIEEKSFLKTIAIASTSNIPHQLHQKELEIILENAANYYPFIKQISDKIRTLFLFKVPYYFGPLNAKSNYSNVVLKEEHQEEHITPYNYKDIVDTDKTRERFIKRLINECTYLCGEKVLPKASLDYEKYLILNKLNTIQINGSLLPLNEKQECFQYILKNKKTTLSQLKKYLSKVKHLDEKEILISGIKDTDSFSSTSYATLSDVFNLSDSIIYEKVNNLIEKATIYAEDKKLLKEVLKQEGLKKDELNAILNLPTNKWAPFSKKLLTGLTYFDDANICYSILDLLEQTSQNFQQILNNELYDFNSKIKIFNDEIQGNQTTNERIKTIMEKVPSLQARSIHQALLIIDDVIKANHQKQPQKIFVEVTRTNDEKLKGKETNSRKKELEDFLNGLKTDLKNNHFLTKESLSELQDELNELNNVKLRGKHLFLYFKQMGYDLYTGKKINIEDVLNATKYDLDHIIPQSLIKDDSLDNLVLVEKETNQKWKKDIYPIPLEIKTDEIIKLWKWLNNKKAISPKKFTNLMRNTEITEVELQDFVNRQINVVNSSNKVLKDILEIKYPNTKVVFSKAQYPSNVRQFLKIAKNRDLNDAHHGVDAYLNIFCGNVLSTKFSDVRAIYASRKYSKNTEDSLKTFNMENYLKRYLEKNSHLKDKVKANCLRHDALVTFKTVRENGMLYKQTICPKGDGALIPTHTNSPLKDVSKYGGYTSLVSSYIMALQYEENGKVKKELLRVPLLYDKQYPNKDEAFYKLIIGKENISNIKLLKIINLNQKIKYEKGIYLLYTSNEKQNKFKMAYQNYLDNDLLYYLQNITKLIQKESDLDDKVYEAEQYQFITSRKNNINSNDETNEINCVSKVKNEKLFDEIMNHAHKEVYDTCSYINKLRNIDKSKFKEFNLKKQVVILNLLIGMFSRNAESINFKKEYNDIVLMDENIFKKSKSTSSVTLINESPAGLYRNEEKI